MYTALITCFPSPGRKVNLPATKSMRKRLKEYRFKESVGPKTREGETPTAGNPFRAAAIISSSASALDPSYSVRNPVLRTVFSSAAAPFEGPIATTVEV